MSINYDDSKTFRIDCQKFVPVYGGQTAIECSYCGSVYSDPSMANKLCLTCGLSVVGVKTIGLVTG
jgi:uncharacterized OB-fold protein